MSSKRRHQTVPSGDGDTCPSGAIGSNLPLPETETIPVLGGTRDNWGPGTDSIEFSLADIAGLRRCVLHVIAGPDAGTFFVPQGDRVTIGSHPSNELVLTDSTVSRTHCEIELCDGLAVVRDLSSRNGTRVDGVHIETARLTKTSILGIGHTTLRVEIGSRQLPGTMSSRERFGQAVGRSPAMRSVFSCLEQVATSDATVLLCGETGTGKDVLAESIHQHSARARGPFLVVDCAALPGTLLASELFGHVKGSFTGADRHRVGAAEAASGGTLFLDEIGELDVDVQPKLLRLLQRREVIRVGETRPVPVDVRVIAATSRKLREEVTAGRFRSDLYYRLAVVEVNVPPLRERKEDIPLLVRALLESAGASPDAADKLTTGVMLERMSCHDWPGNVRELRNYVQRCLAMTEVPALGEEHDIQLPSIDASLPLREARERWQKWFERRYLEQLLSRHRDNVSGAARAAGVDRVYLHRLLRRAGLR